MEVHRPSGLELLLKSALPLVEGEDGAVSIGLPLALRRPARLLGSVAGMGSRYYRRLVEPTDVTADPSAPDVPRTRFNGAVGTGRTTGGVRFDLGEIKAVKNAFPGTTVNDVVTAVVGGALRTFLLTEDELPDRSLIAAMPMSVRTGAEIAEGGNRLNVSTVVLGTDIADPLERLRTVHDSTTQSKSVLGGTGARQLVEMADSIPAGMFGVGGRLAAQFELSTKFRLANTVVTNVPGPGVPLYLAGATMTQIYGYAVAAPGLALVHVVSSYCGALTVGFQAGAALLPDSDFYEDCLRASFDELRSAAEAGVIRS
jgi:WS/DGAT/MGAT family acyltransferase